MRNCDKKKEKMSTAEAAAAKKEATREWLREQKFEDAEEVESLAESSVVESSDGDYGATTDTETDPDETVSTQTLGTQSGASSEVTATTSQYLEEILRSLNRVQMQATNVSIENSTGMHIGNVNHIHMPVQVLHAQTKKKTKSRKSTAPKTTETPATRPADSVEREERVCSDAFINRAKLRRPKELCPFVRRHRWLAQQPMEKYEHMQEPVEYVVISHTATESSEKQAINIRIIRDIQCFHIESREWNDIAYNFLIGCDGNVYEGRGWGVVGAHTLGYNRIAIGICFIGCFMQELPTKTALNTCRNFLKRGIEEGHLAADYKLVCHCQCSSTESPGRKLFEEIQQWPHFYSMEDDADEAQG